MKKKAMIIATVSGFIASFEKNDIKILKKLGYEIIVASNFKNYEDELEELNIEKLDIPFVRNPFSLKNIKVFFKLNKYLKENKIELIHCHTPVGGVVGRILGKWNKVSKIIYTAHGFHFFNGAPFINWLIYYPIEKILSKFTDILITINQEDYKRAKTFYAKKVEYIPGVGIDVEKIRNIKIDREKKRKELGLTNENIVLLSVGELNKNKNHIVPIKALAKLNNKNIYYLIAGQGPLESFLRSEIEKLKLENQVKLLGFRNDIYELDKIVDIFIFPSLREGLSVALMESICCNIPVICSNIRGNNDLIENGKNGFLAKNEENEYVEKLNFILNNKEFKNRVIETNRELINSIDLKKIEKKMFEIYRNNMIG